MKKYITCFIIICSFSMLGCKKFLTSTPQDFSTPETYFKDEKSATLALNAVYAQFSKQFFLRGYWQARMVGTNDGIYSTVSNTFTAGLNITANNDYVWRTWQVVYQTIERANVFLANIDKVEMDTTKRNYLKGEALFARGYCYFFLVTQWGALPLRLVPTVDANDVDVPRTPIKEVYDQILKDMMDAEKLVPTTANPNYGGAGYVAKTGVQAMLTRVCLTMASRPLKDRSKFAEAKVWAQKVISSNEHALNPSYQNIFINMVANIYDKKESIWEIDMVDAGPTVYYYSDLGYLNGLYSLSTDSGRTTGQARTTRLLWKAYEPNDLRRDWNIAPFQINANGTYTYASATPNYTRFPGKWRLSYSPYPRTVGRTNINFPVIRYTDVLMMYAEADNEINQHPTPQAYEYVNQVRRRGYGKPITTPDPTVDLPTGLSYEDFVRAIQDERLREFPSEALRKADLIRWGLFVQKIREVKADANDPNQQAVTGVLLNILNIAGNIVSDRDTLWPIPPGELLYNKVISQNPGW